MKKNLIISALLVFSCSSNGDSKDNPLPAQTVKVSGCGLDPRDKTYAKTIFEFVDGNPCISYANCTNNNLCSYTDFNALDGADRIPSVDSYTFNRNTLIWDKISRAVSFECDGGITLNENSYKLWGLNSNCNQTIRIWSCIVSTISK